MAEADLLADPITVRAVPVETDERMTRKRLAPAVFSPVVSVVASTFRWGRYRESAAR